MRVAWFRAAPAGLEAEASSALLQALAPHVAVTLITSAEAHDFVVEQALRPYDVCVFEPRTGPASDFIWGYLFNYPGVLLLREASLHDSRVRLLERFRREADYRQEFLFNHGHAPRGRARLFARGHWPMLRAPLLASTLVAVEDGERALALQDAFPGIRVHVVPPAAAGPAVTTPSGRSASAITQVAVAGAFHRQECMREIARLQARGIPVGPMDVDLAGDSAADVVIALDSPTEPANLVLPLSAMAEGKAVIVFEREATAIWPALDPQTWRPRGLPQSGQPPVVVSIDPRDEAHSLRLALTRLADDAPTRAALASAARAWWLAHATPAHAAAAWTTLLEAAAAARPPARPADWPPHLSGDSLRGVRRTLGDFALSQDALWLDPWPSTGGR